MPEPCERCGEPVGPNCKPRLCIDCTLDDFDGACEMCGKEVAMDQHIDGLCRECATIIVVNAIPRDEDE